MSLPPIGVEAPPFRLDDLAGRPVALTDLLAFGPAWLLFYKRDCRTCAQFIPYLRRLAEEIPDLAGSLVLISQDGADETAAFAAEHRLAGPVLRDVDPWPVSQAYGVRAVPSHLLVETSGIVAATGEGFVRAEWEAMARNLALRSGAPGFALFRADDAIPEFKPG